MLHTAVEAVLQNGIYATMLLLIALGIYLFAFRKLARLHPHVGGDELAHLSYINNYRKQCFPYALDHRPQAHHLFNLIMSLVPEEKTLHAGRIINLLFVLAFYLPVMFYLSLSLQWPIAMFAIAFSMLSPWGVGLNVARLATCTERAWSDFFFVLGLFLFLICEEHGLTSIFLSALSWAFIWPSSSFNRQSAIFISLAYWLLSGDGSLLGIAIYSYLIAVICFGPVINRQVINQARHMRWYFENRRFLLYRDHLIEASSPSGLRSAKRIITGIVSDKLLFFSPFFLFYSLLFLFHFEEDQKSTFIVMSALAVTLCTAIGPSRILGPSARYWSFVQPLVYGILLSSSQVFVFALLVETIVSMYLSKLKIRSLLAGKEHDARINVGRLVAELNQFFANNEIVLFSNMKLASSINSSSIAPLFKTVGIGFERYNSIFLSKYVRQYPYLSIELISSLDECEVSALVFEKQDKNVDHETNLWIFEKVICVEDFVVYYDRKV